MTVHCLTPNPALDVTYHLESSLAVHAVNRVGGIARRPGGKGVNVARLLAAEGAAVAAYGFLGQPTGSVLSDLLTGLSPSIVQRWTRVAADTRRTIAVVDGQDTTMLNESGGEVDSSDWAELVDGLAANVAAGDVLTISGSLPPGSTAKDLVAAITAARAKGAVVVADTSGSALLAAAAAGADVLKPNRDELLEVVECEDVASGVQALIRAGAGAVVASMGPDGLLLGLPGSSRTARLPEPVSGNPTGAGDAVVAAIAYGLASAPDPDDQESALTHSLTRAVAWSAAAVLSPVAGEIDRQTAQRLESDVVIREV